jgi:hypothetical protein
MGTDVLGGEPVPAIAIGTRAGSGKPPTEAASLFGEEKPRHPFRAMVWIRRCQDVVADFYRVDRVNPARGRDGKRAAQVIESLALYGRLCRAIGAAGAHDSRRRQERRAGKLGRCRVHPAEAIRAALGKARMI